jgi:hypothetical protein
MSGCATGRLVEETGRPYPDLVVTVRDETLPGAVELGRSMPTGDDGRFTISFRAGQFGGRTLRFQVLNQVLRELQELEPTDDVSGSMLALGDVTISRQDGAGFQVTMETDTPAFGSRGDSVLQRQKQRSTAAAFGATTFSKLSRALESLTSSGMVEGTAGLITQIEAEYDRVRIALETVRERGT